MVAALFLITGAILIPLRVPAKPRGDAPHEGTLAALRSGLRYAAHTRAVRDLLTLSAITEMFGFAYLSVLPVVARDVLHQTATGLGVLAAGSSAGQFVAMIGLSLAGDVRRKGLILIGSTLAFGIAVVGLGLSSVFVLSLAIVFFVGAAASLYDTSMWTVVQMTASEEMRGRVLGLYMSTFGLSQIGGFVLGAVASIATVPLALGLAGTIVALNAARLLPAIARFTPR
jgi:MFS family permease